MQGSSVQVYQVYEVTRFQVGDYEVYEVPSLRLEVEVGGWRLEVGGLELFLRGPPQPSPLLSAWGSELPGDLKSTKIVIKKSTQLLIVFSSILGAI